MSLLQRGESTGPMWTTAQRPNPYAQNPYPFGFNVDISAYEYWDGGTWVQVGGGGGGVEDSPIVSAQPDDFDVTFANALEIITIRPLLPGVVARLGGSGPIFSIIENNANGAGPPSGVPTWSSVVVTAGAIDLEIPVFQSRGAVKCKVYEDGGSVLAGHIDMTYLTFL